MLPVGQGRRIAAWIVGLSVVLGAVACSLIHESFLFLGAPAAMYLLIACVRLAGTGEVATKMVERRAVVLFLGLIAFSFLVTSVVFHGGAQAADGIWERLTELDRQLVQPSRRGGIGALSLGMKDMWTLPLMAMGSGMAWWYFAPLVLMMLYCLTLVILNLQKEAGGKTVVAWLGCYGWIFLGALPMFALGWDWGRWAAGISTCFLIVWLSVREEELLQTSTLFSINRLRRWGTEHAALERLTHVADVGVRIVRRHTGAAVFVLTALAVTLRIPELYLEDSQTFIVNFGLDLLWSHLHKHP
jgi:hypothetical protein